MKMLVMLCALLAVSGPAIAKDWYIFDVGNLTCLNARLVAQQQHQPEFADPYAFRQAARGQSSYGGTKVYHYPNGQMGVVIAADHRDLFFLSSLSTCLIFKHVYTSTGHSVSNLSELK